MARIRSIHPEQPIDEDFVQCGPWARLLAIFIRNHADDHGIFEWKPIQLKIKIFPCDDVDVAALLEELIANNQVVRFEHEGREYGAIRNFCRYQRPKKPKSIHFIPDELRPYVGLEPVSSEPVPHHDRSGGEKSPQMEVEEGGESSSEAKASAPGDLKAMVFGPGLDWLAESSGRAKDGLRSLAGRWCKRYGEAAVIEALGAAQRHGPLEPVSWIEGTLKERGKPKPNGGITPIGVGG